MCVGTTGKLANITYARIIIYTRPTVMNKSRKKRRQRLLVFSVLRSWFARAPSSLAQPSRSKSPKAKTGSASKFTDPAPKTLGVSLARASPSVFSPPSFVFIRVPIKRRCPREKNVRYSQKAKKNSFVPADNLSIYVYRCAAHKKA